MRKLLFESLLIFLAVFYCQGIYAQDVTISGVIIDNTNLPVPSANVKEKGTKQETSTDFDGKFQISVKEGATIIISSIGYKTVELKAAAGMTIKLAPDTNELNGVTVTALGQSKKNKSIGYATSIIKADAITKTASPTIANSLYGKAPGVRISSTPGGAGAINIQIRGLNSITGKNQPLIVLDGVPIRDGEVNNNDYWNQQRVKSNGLADINPEDIENISILKGASAAALYGSEAVNGVVLITSKSGKGKKGLGIDFSTSYSNNQIAFLPRFQYERGPGYSNPAYSTSAYLAPDGFAHYDTNGDGIADMRGVSNGSSNYVMGWSSAPVFCSKKWL
jgi:iron complex outermembrane receptor protein